MALRNFLATYPQVHPSAYVDPDAVVIGDVHIGAESSVWPMAVIRGDVNSIRIGEQTNIQDGAILHVSHAGDFNPKGAPLNIGNQVTVGHQAILHACTIGDHCLIGMGASVLDEVIIEPKVMLGAGSLVPPGKCLTSGYLWLGNPVKQIRPLTERELAFLIYSAEHYCRLKAKYCQTQTLGE